MRMPRARFTVTSMMISVAIAGLLANRLRPVSQGEAVELATRRYRQLPGAAPLDRVEIHSDRADGDRKYYWLVNFWVPEGNRQLIQISTDSRGEIMGVVRVPASSDSLPVGIPAGPAPVPVHRFDRSSPLPRGQGDEPGSLLRVR